MKCCAEVTVLDTVADEINKLSRRPVNKKEGEAEQKVKSGR